MPVLGVWAATGLLARGAPAPDLLRFYIIQTTDMVAFAGLILFAYHARFDSAAHKRLIIIASTALMTAPIARFEQTHVDELPMMGQRVI
jgi:hypothetical protein